MTRGISVRCLLLATMVMLGLPRSIDAQCFVYKVTVDGKVHSAAKDTQVLVRVHANPGKKTSQAIGTPERNQFHISVGFDTFVSVRLFGAHDCSRRPTAVDVMLLVDGVAKQTVKLSLDRDFTLDEKLAEWRSKVPLILSESPSQ